VKGDANLGPCLLILNVIRMEHVTNRNLYMLICLPKSLSRDFEAAPGSASEKWLVELRIFFLSKKISLCRIVRPI
jgi:hypothetical protein